VAAKIPGWRISWSNIFSLREYIARLLSARWTVETSSDGLAALESIRKRPPTLVVTDVMMPRLDGFELLREIRKDPTTRRIPVGMRERVRQLKGKMQIQSDQTGTKITVTLPAPT
jgi:CheY-like chemotaxis protein